MKTLNPNPKYHQGYYRVRNVDKYVGDINNVIYRSSLERKFMSYCDFNDKVTFWGSENVVIPYYYLVDQKVHKYMIDFFIIMNEIKYLVEIKPQSSLYKPIFKDSKKNNLKALRNYQYAMAEYIKNSCKWEAAKKFAKARNCRFIVLTDKEIQKL